MREAADEIDELRAWLDIATTMGGIPEHAIDDIERYAQDQAARYSDAHPPSKSKSAEINTYLQETYRDE